MMQNKKIKELLAFLLSLRSSARRRWLYYFKRNYVQLMLASRKGSCEGCPGVCCERTRKCPFLEQGRCRIYNSKIPKFCLIFPIDKKDIELAGVEDVCQFYWQ